MSTFTFYKSGMVRSVSTEVGPVLPERAVAFLKRRLFEGSGLLLFAAAGGFVTLLASYAPSDPSWNTAAAGPPSNLLGAFGAHIADLTLQSVGAAGALLPIALAAWGWLLIDKRRVSIAWLRMLLLIAAVVLLAIGLSAVTVPADWPLASGLGGAAGTLLMERALTVVHGLGAAIQTGVLGAAVAVFAVAALIGALALPWSDWRAAGRALLATGVFMVSLAVRGSERLHAMAGNAVSWRERREPVLDSDAAFEADDVTEEMQVDPPSKRRNRLVATRSAKTKVGRKADAQRQGTLDLAPDSEYQFPPLNLLEAAPADAGASAVSQDALEQNARLLESVLEDFGVHGEIVKVRPGPVVTLYELEPAPGTKTSRVIGLSDDIARSMSAVSVRVAVIPGRNVIGIELPNARRETVYLNELLASADLEKAAGKLMLALGKDIGGVPILVDLARMPHLLIAGTTGSGKSVALNTMVLALLYQLPPEACRFIMIDPKMLELSVYEGIPHLLCPVVTEPSKAVVALKWTVREMEERYRLMSQLGVRSVAGYNARVAEAVKQGETLTRRVQTGFHEETGEPVFEDVPLSTEPLPFIVVVVDEMADLMLVAGKDIEATVQRLSQMARAAGIHLIMATQRPSVDVITGTIKANFPSRVSFQVTSKIDSRTILGEQGAEQLLGQGDMLYMAGGGRISRVHGPFVSDEEVERVVDHLSDQGEPVYLDAVTEDDDAASLTPASGGDSGEPLYDEAMALVAREGKASTSFIQRHLQIGYNRAARIIERMEADGVVSQANRVGRREVLIGNGP